MLTQLEKQRLVVAETSDKVDYLHSKVQTTERHLPVMIQEILEFYFDKKVNDLLGRMVTKDDFKKALSVKLDSSIFRDHEKRQASDRTQELKNRHFDDKVHELERTFMLYPTKEELASEMREKVSVVSMEELRDSFHKFQTIHHTTEETLTTKLNNLKEDYENKTKELFEQLDDLKEDMKHLDEDSESYDDEQEDSDQDLESELGDTLDVNEITRDVHFDRESDETPKDGKGDGEDGKEGSESGDEEPESGAASKENRSAEEGTTDKPETAAEQAKSAAKAEATTPGPGRTTTVIEKSFEKPDPPVVLPKRLKAQRSMADQS